MREHPRTLLVLHPWLQAVSQAGLPLHASCPSPLQPGQMLPKEGWQGAGEVSKMFDISTNVD